MVYWGERIPHHHFPPVARWPLCCRNANRREHDHPGSDTARLCGWPWTRRVPAVRTLSVSSAPGLTVRRRTFSVLPCQPQQRSPKYQTICSNRPRTFTSPPRRPLIINRTLLDQRPGPSSPLGIVLGATDFGPFRPWIAIANVFLVGGYHVVTAAISPALVDRRSADLLFHVRKRTLAHHLQRPCARRRWLRDNRAPA